jgi:hypothetical protein
MRTRVGAAGPFCDEPRYPARKCNSSYAYTDHLAVSQQTTTLDKFPPARSAQLRNASYRINA